MEVSYKSIGNKNFLILPCSETGKNIDTQARMLTSGDMKHILPVNPTSKNGNLLLQYDITGLTKLSSITQYGKLSGDQFLSLLESLVAAVEECDSFALSPNGICINEDHIFVNIKQNRTMFIYNPTLRDGRPTEGFQNFLRSLIAFGKVEHSALSASVTDIINQRTFSLAVLKESLQKLHNLPFAPQLTIKNRPVQNMAPNVPLNAAPSAPARMANAMAQPRQEPQSATPFSAPAPVPAQSPQKRKSAKSNANLIKIILLVTVSVAAIVGACFTSAVRQPEGGLDISKVLGLLILFGALDFLLLRNWLKKTPDASDDKSVAQDQKQDLKSEKAKSAPMPLPAPLSSGAPFSSPSPAPFVPLPSEKLPQAGGAPPSGRLISSPPAPIQPGLRTAEPDADETVELGEPGAAGGLYLQTAGGEVVFLSKSPFLIGRDRAVSDYVLDDVTVGRKHAELRQQEGGWVLEDQNSRNHTFLNEQHIPPYTPYPIAPGDTIRIAKITLWIKS